MERLCLTIKFTSSKNCFISLPSIAVRTLSGFEDFSNIYVTATDGEKEFQLGCNGTAASSESLEISGAFAQQLGLVNGQEIVVTISRSPLPICRQVELEPLTENDWELICQNAEEVEELLLNQLSVIYVGLSFPVWVHRGIVKLFLKVATISCDGNSGRISQQTEVVIKPYLLSPSSTPGDSKNTKEQSRNEKSSVVSSFFNKFTTMFNNKEASPEENRGQNDVELHHLFNGVSESCELKPLRVLMVDSDDEDMPLCNTVFVNIHEFELPPNQYAVAQLAKIPSPSLSTEPDKSGSNADGGASDSPFDFKALDFLKTYVLVRGSQDCNSGCICVCDSLRRQMNLCLNSRVILKRTGHEKTKLFNKSIGSSLFEEKQKVGILSSLCVTPVGVSKCDKESIKTLLRNYCQKHGCLVVSHGTVIRMSSTDYLATINKEKLCCSIFESDLNEIELELTVPMFQRVTLSPGVTVPATSLKDVDNFSKFNLCSGKGENLAGFEHVIPRVKSFLDINLSLKPVAQHLNAQPSSLNALLICGPKGSGKTNIIEHVCQEYANKLVSVRVIGCKSLRGRRLDALHKTWHKELASCLYYQPSILVFEDLDVVSSASRLEESEVEALYAYRVALIFISLVKATEKIQRVYGGQVAILATCTSFMNLHSSLILSRGRHIFTEIVELKPPTLNEREAILRSVIQRKCRLSSLDFDLKDISRRCESYLPCDLSVLVDKALHYCAIRCSRAGVALKLNSSDFENAITEYQPSSMRGVASTVKSKKSLKDVGGLSEVKKTLLETFLWPSKYPILFSKCPIRSQSCVLLFGPPGTGKTLLAEALAVECGINFISIQGPELLSKYIGASELAVRNLFKRANSAKPCILFFDEFDAIAPRRGHDSTGVTDRVVNQLLTQMDGVEALGEGVFILAATSRPDLLDPALLRPGRFDKCLYCPMPNTEERQEILSALSCKLTFNEDVDLKEISEKTSDYTGADLQALLYTAQMEALQEKLKNEVRPELERKIECNSKDKNGRRSDIYYLESLKKGFNHDLPPKLVADLEKQMDIIKSNHEVSPDGNSERIESDCPHGEDGNHVIRIGRRHLEMALQSTKPSISREERERYLQLRRAFAGLQPDAKLLSTLRSSKKVTLA